MKKFKNGRAILTICSILAILVLVVVSASQVVQAATKDNKALFQSGVESFAKGDVDAVAKLMAPNFVDHNPSPGQAPGLEGIKQMVTMFHTAFPDMMANIEVIVAEGDKVAARMTYGGTHKGELMGIAPSGKQIMVSGIDYMRFADGKIVERWGSSDDLGMMRQLGMAPMPQGQAGGMMAQMPVKKEQAHHAMASSAMSAEKNKELVRRFNEEVWNKGNLALIDELIAKDYVSHDPANPPGAPPGPEGLKQFVTMYRAAYPDAHIATEDQIAEGDLVATRWTGSGTNKGELMGIAPTGKKVTVPGVTISRISGGKVAEEWTNWDTLGMMQQLGVVPMATNDQPNQPLIVPSGKGKTVNILGHEITFKLTRQETGGAYFVFEAVSPPGAGVPPHVHQYEDETIYVIEGEFEVLHGDQTHKATQGSVWNLPRNMPHGFRNSGATPGKTLWTVTPGGYLEKSFEEIAALPSGGPPDMEKIMGIFKKYGIEFLPPPK